LEELGVLVITKMGRLARPKWVIICSKEVILWLKERVLRQISIIRLM
jgi:hypothetical protein